MADRGSLHFNAQGGRFTLTPSLGVTVCEYLDKFHLPRNYNDCPTWCWRPHGCIFIRLDKNVSDRQTVGQTDRRTDLSWLLQQENLAGSRDM